MLTDRELDTICDSFVAANRAEFLDTDLDVPIQRAIETIVAQREAAAVKAALLDAATDFQVNTWADVITPALKTTGIPALAVGQAVVDWLRDRANRSEGGRA